MEEIFLYYSLCIVGVGVRAEEDVSDAAGGGCPLQAGGQPRGHQPHHPSARHQDCTH